MTGTPQQYCLRWNNYQNNLTNVFDQLLQSEAFVDVSLACDGQSLKCHKMVLSACSPFFQNLFFDNPCSHPIVILKDIRWEELKAVVEFMYRGEINVSQEQLAPLLKVAEVLKIRGLADVSRGSSGSDFLSSSSLQQQQQHHHHSQHHGGSGGGAGGGGGDSDNEGGNIGTNNLNSSRNHTPVNGTAHQSLVGIGGLAHHLNSSLRRKRRKISTPDRTPSPADTLDDQSNQHELESNNGDYGLDHSPALSSSGCEPSALVGVASGGSNNSSNNNTPSSTSINSINPNSVLTGGQGGSGGLSSSAAAAVAASLSMGPAALLNLHNAAASATSSVSNELDLKPGIVEMIREEERAKMLESSHGWLGPSASTLSDSYQYQIQSLWQKCWNTNQSGMIHALRFRERGPLKSWRPETMAEAIFAVLREGLSLSQAARKYDIPYPTFVLYANRVHNMLGPSGSEGCSGTDLIADMRPKGRGRPQRILLGSWPEDHIRGVIRAVVFRDTGGKDDVPFLYGRDSAMCVPAGTSQANGLDMSLHPQFSGGGGSSSPFLSPHSSSSQQQGQNISNPVGGASSSLGSSSSSSNHQGGGGGGGGHTTINSNESGGGVPTAQQLLQQHHAHQQGSSSSTCSSPLQMIAAGLAAQHSSSGSPSLSSVLQQQHRHHHHPHSSQRSGSSSSSSSSSMIPLLNLKGSRSLSMSNDGDDLVLHTNPEIMQIKAEIPFDDLDDEEDPDDNITNESEDEEDIDHSATATTVSVIASTNNTSSNVATSATATAVVVSPSSQVSTPDPSPPSSVVMTNPGNASSSDGNGNFLPEPEVITSPPHFQAS